MENSEKIIHLDSDILDFLSEVEVIEREDLFSNDVHHIHLHECKSDSFASGSAFSKEGAFIKAQSELFERLTRKFYAEAIGHRPPLSGFSCHRTLEQARQSALSELVERDVFFSSWFSGKNPNWDIQDRLGKTTLLYLQKERQLFHLKGLTLRVGIVGRCSDYYIVLSSLHDQKERFGFIVSTSCEKSLDQAVVKSIVDQHRAGTYLLNAFNNGEKFHDWSGQLLSSVDHQNYYLNVENSRKLDSYFNHSDNEIELSPTQHSFIHFSFSQGLNLKLQVVLCESPQAQPFLIGDGNIDKLNYDRLLETISISSERKIHPLG